MFAELGRWCGVAGCCFAERDRVADEIDLFLLKKVGGGYMFIHRMLLEYFAELDPKPTTGKTDVGKAAS